MGSTNDWKWTDHAPAEPGWYATLLCYEPREGWLPHAMRSDGGKWEEALPVSARGRVGPFQTKKEAEAWGYEHDPDL